MSALDDLIARDSAAQVATQPQASAGADPLAALITRDSAMATAQTAAPASAAAPSGAPSAAPSAPAMSADEMLENPDVMALPTMAGVKRGALAAKQGMQDTLTGGAQLIEHALPFAASLDKRLGVPTADQIATNAERSYQADRAALGGSGTDIIRGIARGATVAPLMALAPEASPWLMGPAVGAVSGAMTPVPNAPQGDLSGIMTGQNNAEPYWQQALTNAGLGAAGGLAGPALGALGRNVVAPTVSAGARKLLDMGVPLTPGQMLGGAANRIEQGLTSVPVLGDAIKNAQVRAAQGMNTAVVNQALAPIGESLTPGTIGHAAIEQAAGKIGNAYDGVIDRIGAAPVDSQLIGDLTNLRALASNLPNGAGDQFHRILQNEVLSRISTPTVAAPATITGEGLKAAEANLGNLARGYARSTDFDQQQLGTAISQAQATMRDWLQRVSPGNAADLAAINRSYALLQRPQRAASSVAADGGVFSGDQLYSATKALDPSKNKAAFARGNALMQDTAGNIKSVMGSKVPDSGTPFRSMTGLALPALAGHAFLPPMALPFAGAGIGAGMLPYTQAGGAAARALIAGGAGWRAPLGAAIGRSGGFLAPSFGALAASNGPLNQ